MSPVKQDMTPRYGGRVVKVTCFVNTDEDEMKISKKVVARARGIRNDAVMTMVEVYTGETAKEVWTTLCEMAAGIAADPRSTDIDLVPDDGER